MSPQRPQTAYRHSQGVSVHRHAASEEELAACSRQVSFSRLRESSTTRTGLVPSPCWRGCDLARAESLLASYLARAGAFSTALADRGGAPLCLLAAFARGFTLSLCSLYSIESTSACQLASTTLLDNPTVPHRRLPSVDSISTRTRASVPAPLSSTRTL